jgi:hypothetical protein
MRERHKREGDKESKSVFHFFRNLFSDQCEKNDHAKHKIQQEIECAEHDISIAEKFKRFDTESGERAESAAKTYDDEHSDITILHFFIEHSERDTHDDATEHIREKCCYRKIALGKLFHSHRNSESRKASESATEKDQSNRLKHQPKIDVRIETMDM